MQDCLSTLTNAGHHQREEGNSMTSPDPGKSSSRVGGVLDFAVPIAIQLAAFFGLQAHLNSGGGIQIRLGAGMFFKLLIPSLGLYFFLLKPILRTMAPQWWGRPTEPQA